MRRSSDSHDNNDSITNDVSIVVIVIDNSIDNIVMTRCVIILGRSDVDAIVIVSLSQSISHSLTATVQ